MMKSRIFLYMLFSITSIYTSTAQCIDSVKTVLASKQHDSIIQHEITKILQQPNITKKALANCYHEYGKWWYRKWKRNKQQQYINNAINCTQKAVTLKKAISTTKKSLKRSLYNLGVFHSRKKNYIQAISYYEQVIDIIGIDNKTLGALRELSRKHMNIGDFHKALSNLNILIQYISKKNDAHRKRLIEAYIKRAEIYSAMGREKFSRFIKEDINTINAILTSYTGNKTQYYAEIYQLEGNRLLENGFYQEAIPYFKKVLANIPKNDSINLARVYNSLGQSYAKLKEYPTAFVTLDKAIAYNPHISVFYENKGDIYVQQQEYLKSLQEYQKAINTVTNASFTIYEDIPPATLEYVQHKLYLLTHFIQKANAWVSFYHTTNIKSYLHYALSTYETADTLIDMIRFESTAHKSKLFWREKGASLYLGAVEVCYLLNNPEKAFYFMEKNKAILLLEDISNHQAMENARIPLPLASKALQLKNAVNSLKTRLQNNKTDSLQQQLYLSKRTYTSFMDSLLLQYPDYKRYKKQIPIIPYKKASEFSTKQQTLLLQYITHKEKAYGMLLGTATPIFFEVFNAKNLTKHITEFQQYVHKKLTTVQEQQAYHTIAHTLFTQLIPKVVFKKLKGKKVILIPDYKLQELSFETLATTNQPHSFLLQDTELSYAYSLSHLINNNNITRQATKNFLGIAPVNFDSLKLPTLQHTLSEVTNTQKLYSGTAMLYNQATISNFLNTAGTYKALHLATHAEANDTELPWIAFSDAKLSLQELYGYKNQHEMVTLSACKTSLGKLQVGEGLMSLARGFFYGGAKSVVSSLWASDDKASKKIIVNFYKNLKKGASKAQALRQAKLHYLKTHQGIDASPFYWGNYILIGDSNTLDLQPRFFTTKNILIGIISSLILLVVLLFRKRYHTIKSSQDLN